MNISCYTAGYSVIVKVKIPNAYSSQKEKVKLIMEKFKEEHIDLMIDSNMVNKYFNKRNYYYDKVEEEQVFYSKKLYPLFPVYNWVGLHTWYIKTKDNSTVFELGLYADGFAISEFCIISNENKDCIYNDRIEGMGKKGVFLKRQYKEKFDKEILPLLKPYFIPDKNLLH